MEKDNDFISIRVSGRVYLIKQPNSKYWKMRIYNPTTKRHRVESTKELTKGRALKYAEAYRLDFEEEAEPTDRENSVGWFANKLNNEQRAKSKANIISTATYYNDERALNRKGGFIDVMGGFDITTITPKQIYEGYEKVMSSVANGNPSAASYNRQLVCLKKIFNTAVGDGTINSIPQLPKQRRSKSETNHRTAFTFGKKSSEWETIQRFVKTNVGKTFRCLKGKNEYTNIQMDDDFYDLLQLLINGFFRPNSNEIFGIRFRDVEVKETPKRLTIRVVGGKTEIRFVDTMAAAVSAFERIKERAEERGYSDDDYILFPQYSNRTTIQRRCNKLFTNILKEMGIYEDREGNSRSLYSLRHTSIQMRLVNSKGKVNVYSLAKNAGTSVEMIERFYAKSLPNSDEIAANLQSFGD